MVTFDEVQNHGSIQKCLRKTRISIRVGGACVKTWDQCSSQMCLSTLLQLYLVRAAFREVTRVNWPANRANWWPPDLERSGVSRRLTSTSGFCASACARILVCTRMRTHHSSPSQQLSEIISKVQIISTEKYMGNYCMCKFLTPQRSCFFGTLWREFEWDKTVSRKKHQTWCQRPWPKLTTRYDHRLLPQLPWAFVSLSIKGDGVNSYIGGSRYWETLAVSDSEGQMRF